MVRLVCLVTGVEVEAQDAQAEMLAASGFRIVDGAKENDGTEKTEGGTVGDDDGTAGGDDGAFDGKDGTAGDDGGDAGDPALCRNPEKPDTEAMTVKDLARWCKQHGIAASKGWKRADFVEAIEKM